MVDLCIDFLAGGGFFSWLIEWFGLGHGGYSHCAAVLPDGRYLDARSDAMHGTWRHGPYKDHQGSVPPGVHIREPTWEKSVRRTRATIQVTQDQRTDFEANLRAKIGDAYAKIGIEGFVTGRAISTKAQYFCSQLAINGLQHIKIFPYPLSVQAHQISPNSLLLMLEANGAKLTDVQKDYQKDYQCS